jgi:hypothetical protein
MSEGSVGRLLVASLHQAVSEVLPSRLEFYEPWLNPATVRAGASGLAPLAAALSFLRLEGDSYARVSVRAGEYTADWTVAALSPLRRRVIGAVPRVVRARLVTGLAKEMVQRTYGAARIRVRWRRQHGTLRLEGSLFCDVRGRVEHPLCEYYASALRQLMSLLELDAEIVTDRCRATGAETCDMSISVRHAGARASR